MRIEETRTELCLRLRERLPEIEAATITRAQAVCDPRGTADPEYTEGFRRTIAAALGYGIEALEHNEERAPPIPTVLLSQARLAARNRVPLDTVMRRYFAGYSLLGDYLIEEAERSGRSGGSSLKRLLRAQATLFDRVMVAVSEEYGREAQSRSLGSEQRLAERVGRLLDGELVDTSGIAYDFEGFHLAAIATGPGTKEAIRSLATELDRSLLVVCPHEEVIWAWWGGRRPPDPATIERILNASWDAQAVLALGEPAEGLAGWRLTHCQARAAMSVALHRAASGVRYADVALLASALQDDLLATSLRQLYLAPLARERDEGEAARETLRAYFAARRNVSSTAAALGVTRQTASSRLHLIEERLGRSLDRCGAELEILLELQGHG